MHCLRIGKIRNKIRNLIRRRYIKDSTAKVWFVNFMVLAVRLLIASYVVFCVYGMFFR